MVVTSKDAPAQAMPVRHLEGLVHGFLVLRTLEGEIVANGESLQSSAGEQVRSRLIYRFKDGSLHDELTIFSQRKSFRLISYHLVQKGPTFKLPMEMWINGGTGQVTVRATQEDGKEKNFTEHMELPVDIANGMVLTLIKNIPPKSAGTTAAYLVATPKPRLVKLEITSQGEEKFIAGDATYKSMHYQVKVQIGGVAGKVAPLVGKQPADTNVWVCSEYPSLVKSEGPLFEGGPIWRLELASPVSKDDSKDGEKR